jgi:hypothetical protein
MDGAQRSQTCEPMNKNRIEPERSGDSRRQPCGRSGAGFGLFFTRACPASERNRRVLCLWRCSASENPRSLSAWTEERSQTRTHGGVGPVAGSGSQSRGPDSASL